MSVASGRPARRQIGFRGPAAFVGLLVLAGLALPAAARDTGPLTPVTGVGSPVDAPHEDAPLQILVSLKEQKLDVFRGTDLITSTRVSSGKRGHSTPTGIFSILEKRRRHFSNLYNNAPMPYMQRLTWSGIALHQGRVPNHPASHGCVRLPKGFARDLFKMTERGGHVVITRERTRPVGVLHAALPRMNTAETAVASLDRNTLKLRPGLAPASLPGESMASATSAPQLVEKPRDPLRILITRTSERERVRDMQRVLDELGYEPGPIDGVMGRKTRAAIRLFQEGAELPVTGTPSRVVIDRLYAEAGEAGPATGRVFVRRKMREIYAGNVVLRDPDAALGTYLFTLIDEGGGISAGRWMSVAAAAVDGVTAGTILDRVEWTADARRFVEDRLTLGSSLIVTDRPFRLHSGLGTDFVVTTRQ